MKKLFLSLIALLSTLPLSGMQTDNSAELSYLDNMPIELIQEVFKFYHPIKSDYLKFVYDITHKEIIKKFYISSEKIRNSTQFAQFILSYCVKRSNLYASIDLQKNIISQFEEYPAFKNQEMIDWIKKEEKRLTDEDILLGALDQKNVADVQKAIKYIVNINSKILNCDCPLIYMTGTNRGIACTQKDTDIIKILLDHNADPNIIIETGSTPLSLHLERDVRNEFFMEITKLLLSHGANPNLGPFKNKSLLKYVNTELGDKNLADLLVQYGAKE
jgi:hypothetical protein